MNEDHNDEGLQGGGRAEMERTSDATVPEDPAAHAIALPAKTPTPPQESELTPPAQPDTPPFGVPGHSQGAVPGTYAMGALAGTPAPGPGSDPSTGAVSRPDGPYSMGPVAGYGAGPGYGAGFEFGGPGFGNPPTQPTAASWYTPGSGAPSTTAKSDHRVRNALLAGGAAAVLLAAGVGIGHAAWSAGGSNPSAAASGGTQHPFHSGDNGSGNGFPFGGTFGNSGNTGGSGNSGSSGPSDVNAIASKIDPGLVDINTTVGYQGEQAAGTGIVLSANGVVLTNNHVIDGATSISVTDVGNHKTYTAKVVGYDRTKDIAVLQLNNASGLQTATLDTSGVSVGENVVGVGNAGGTGGTPSAAGGTVTAVNQSITASDEGDGTSEQLSGLIETNANIQPGDSGGALVNTSGQVVGVDTAASAGFSFQSSGNQGYAIPISTATTLAKAILDGHASSTIHIGPTAFLGVEVSPTGSSNSGFGGFGGFFGNSGNTGNSGGSGSSVSGASIVGTVTNGPAQEAGLAQGDVITSLGGHTVTSANDLTADMGNYHPGDKVAIAWTDSSGNSHTATVQLSSGPPQ
jgi:S1-C subfamily serine protease